MKVRHKQNQNETYEVEEESSAYYVVRWHVDSSLCPAPFAKALPKSSYEPVTEPRWVDVTASCDEAPYAHGGHLNRDGKCFIACPIGYRLRKVRFQDLVNRPDAFIIEQEE